MSGICGAAQTRRTAGALDEQKAPTIADRAAVAEAIKSLRPWLLSPIRTAGASLVLAAAEAWLATLPEPPKTKMVEVWHVEWALSGLPMLHLHYSRQGAEEGIRDLQKESHRTCFRITGPHQHVVPA